MTEPDTGVDDMHILGAGRVGTSLARRAREHGVPCTIHDRSGDLPAGKLLVATRNDDLPAVLERAPSASDLVFLQNGWLRGFLAEHGLEGNTRGLLYFAATERDGAIAAGQTSVFTGPHAPNIVAWFHSLNLEARAVSAEGFGRIELEKLAWLCVFGPLCQRYELTVGEVLAQRRSELHTLTAELEAFGRCVGIEAHLLPGLEAYSFTIPTYRASVKEWKWRNGAVLDAMEAAGVPSPLQRELTDGL